MSVDLSFSMYLQDNRPAQANQTDAQSRFAESATDTHDRSDSAWQNSCCQYHPRLGPALGPGRPSCFTDVNLAKAGLTLAQSQLIADSAGLPLAAWSVSSWTPSWQAASCGNDHAKLAAWQLRVVSGAPPCTGPHCRCTLSITHCRGWPLVMDATLIHLAPTMPLLAAWLLRSRDTNVHHTPGVKDLPALLAGCL